LKQVLASCSCRLQACTASSTPWWPRRTPGPRREAGHRSQVDVDEPLRATRAPPTETMMLWAGPLRCYLNYFDKWVGCAQTTHTWPVKSSVGLVVYWPKYLNFQTAVLHCSDS
jgi:hypothetical protein